jgi:hypothetical protein
LLWAGKPKDKALWTIAHEIAHSRLNQGTGGFDAEVEADRLVEEWGFKEPEGRAAERERHKQRLQEWEGHGHLPPR